jgi:nucleotide-binding universal stress UspA family protein
MTIVQTSKRIALNKILFLTDFSDSSETAVPFATSIARAYGSTIYALHVLLPSAYAHVAPEEAASLLDDEEDRARAEMERVEAQFSGLPNELTIERGPGVWPVLAEVLKQREIDLIIMGTHGRTGIQKLLLGSSAEEIFRRSHAPVLTIGPAVRSGSHSAGRFRCVLFATDFNAVSAASVSFAVSLAQENQSRLVLLHAIPKPKPGKAERDGDLSVAEALHQLQELVPAEGTMVPARGHGAARQPNRPDFGDGQSMRSGLNCSRGSWDGSTGRSGDSPRSSHCIPGGRERPMPGLDSPRLRRRQKKYLCELARRNYESSFKRMSDEDGVAKAKSKCR